MGSCCSRDSDLAKNDNAKHEEYAREVISTLHKMKAQKDYSYLFMMIQNEQPIPSTQQEILDLEAETVGCLALEYLWELVEMQEVEDFIISHLNSLFRMIGGEGQVTVFVLRILHSLAYPENSKLKSALLSNPRELTHKTFSQKSVVRALDRRGLLSFFKQLRSESKCKRASAR